MSDGEKILFANGKNYNYWDSLLPRTINFKEGAADKVYKRSVKNYQRNLNRFKKILESAGADKKKKFIRKLVLADCDNLLAQSKIKTDNLQKCPELTNLIIENPSKNCPELTTSKVSCEIEALSRIDRLIYFGRDGQTLYLSERKCKVTGLDISMQKDNSDFLCTSGIKYYKKYHNAIYIELWKRLSARWHGSSEEIQIREIHHSIRNEYFNRIHNTRRSINHVLSEPALFNQLHLIDKKKLEMADIMN